MSLRETSQFFVILFACLTLATCSCSSRSTGPNAIDADAPTEFTTTESGLRYRILRKSAGRKPQASDRVSVDYSGWLDNGTVFDSSYDRRAPEEFVLSDVIAGWTEGLQLIGVGGMIELEITAQLAYGDVAKSNIPANSTLHFKVELHEIH